MNQLLCSLFMVYPGRGNFSRGDPRVADESFGVLVCILLCLSSAAIPIDLVDISI